MNIHHYAHTIRKQWSYVRQECNGNTSLCDTKFDVGLPIRETVGMQSSKNIVAFPQTAVPLIMALINKLGEVPHSVEACYLTSDIKWLSHCKAPILCFSIVMLLPKVVHGTSRAMHLHFCTPVVQFTVSAWGPRSTHNVAVKGQVRMGLWRVSRTLHVFGQGSIMRIMFRKLDQ